MGRLETVYKILSLENEELQIFRECNIRNRWVTSSKGVPVGILGRDVFITLDEAIYTAETTRKKAQQTNNVVYIRRTC